MKYFISIKCSHEHKILPRDMQESWSLGAHNTAACVETPALSTAPWPAAHGSPPIASRERTESPSQTRHSVE